MIHIPVDQLPALKSLESQRIYHVLNDISDTYIEVVNNAGGIYVFFSNSASGSDKYWTIRTLQLMGYVVQVD